MKTLQEEINESITKNLPAQVGDALKQRLEQADKDVALAASLVKDLATANELIERKDKEISDLYAVRKQIFSLDEREKAISKREDKQHVYELELKVIESEKRTIDAVNFVAMVFKSPVFRKTVSEIDHAVPDGWNSATNVTNYRKTGSTKTETNEID